MAIQSLLVVLALISIASANTPPAPARKPSLVVARPVDNSITRGESAWLGIAADHSFRLKLGAISELGLVAVHELLGDYNNLSVDIRNDVYRDLAKKQKASHIITQNYEIINKGKDVQYLLEMMSADDDKIVLTVERLFPVEEISAVLDSVLGVITARLGVTPSSKAGLFLRTPLIPKKSVSALGKAIAMDRLSSRRDNAAVAREYVRVTQREKGNHLAAYLGSFAAAGAKDFAQAAALLDELLLVAGPVLPDLYLQACDYYRQAQRFRDAVRVATLAEQNGVKGVELMALKAHIFADQGERSKAREAYQKVLSINKDEPRALLFLSQQHNNDSVPQQALELSERLLKLQPDNADGWFEKGRSLHQLKRHDAAIEAFIKVVFVRKDDPPAHAALGDLHALKENHAQAASHYEKAMGAMPDNLPLHFRAALSLRRSGKVAEAIAVLRKIEPHAPGNPRLMRELGLLELGNKDTAGARTHLESFVKSGEKDAEVFLALAGIHSAAGRRADAVRMYTAALPLVSQKNDVRMSLARLLIAESNSAQATTYLREIVAEKPSYPEANRLLGDAALAAGDRKKAREHYLLERRAGGDTPHLQERLGNIAFELGEWQSARTEYLAFVKSGKPDASVFYRLTTALLNVGVLPAAEEYFARGLALKPADPELYLLFARKYAAEKNTRKANEYLQQCLAVAPASEPALLELAALHSASGRDSAAAEVFLRLFGVDNDKNKQHLIKAGHTFERLGKLDKAQECYELFLRKKYTDDDISVRLGMIHFRAGRHSQALTVFETISPAKASESSLLQARAESFRATGQCAKALPLLETLLRTAPTNVRNLEMAIHCYDTTGARDKLVTALERFIATPASPRHQEYAFRLAQLYEQLGRKQNARSQYTKNTTAYPQDVRNHERLGTLLFEAKEFAGAIPVLQKASSAPNSSPQLLQMLATSYTATGDRANASKTYAQILKQSPNDTAVLQELSGQLFAQKQWARAAEHLVILSTLTPNSFQTRWMLGTCYHHLGKHAEAAVELSRAHRLDEKHEPTLQLLVQAYRTTKDTKNLVEALRKLTVLRPADGELHKETGTLLLSEGKLEEATGFLEAALKLRPSDAPLRLSMAEIHKKRGNEEAYVAQLVEALKLNPALQQTHFELGQHLRSKGDSRAATHLKRAVELNPKSLPANFEYGGFLLASGDVKPAVKFLEIAASGDPGNTLWLLAYAQALQKDGKGPAALVAVRKVLAKDEKNAEALVMAGTLSLEAGRQADARGFFQKALAVNRECVVCLESLGDLNTAEKNPSEAVKHFEQARTLDRSNGRISFKLARAYGAAGKHEQAEAELEKTLSIDTANQEALYLLCNQYLRREEIAKASTLFDRYSRAKKTFWYFLVQGELNEARENPDMALIGYTSATRMMPENPIALAGTGRVHLKKGNLENALISLSQALAYDESDPRIIRDLGLVYDAMKEPNSAYKLYKEALRIDGNDPELHFAVARHESARKNHQKSIDHLLKSIGLNPKPAKYHLALGFEYMAMKRWEPSIESFRLAARAGKPEMALEAYKQIGTIYLTNLKDPVKAKEFFSRYVDEGGKDETVLARLKGL